MKKEEIAPFVEDLAIRLHNILQFDLNTDQTIYGCLVRGFDYQELEAKNIWRFLDKEKYRTYNESPEKNLSLTELINGDLITRITILSSSGK